MPRKPRSQAYSVRRTAYGDNAVHSAHDAAHGTDDAVRNAPYAVRKMPDRDTSIVIERVTPELDSGMFPVKTVVGKRFDVEADIFKEGHEILRAQILFREVSASDWKCADMTKGENDRWQGSFIPGQNAHYVYTIEAWVNPLHTWFEFMRKKSATAQDIKSDVEEGIHLLEKMADGASDSEKKDLQRFSDLLSSSRGSGTKVASLLQAPRWEKLAAECPLKKHTSRYERELELVVDRKKAECGAWYELFVRSQSPKKGRSGTFQDCIKQLGDIKKMGFDTLYLAPIHPIGRTNRKGPNNSLVSDKHSPGSPWAIGAEEGGHKSIHPDLGTIQDFEDFVRAAEELGIEIALDYALQCSPDHPYVREHPEWFYQLPDGTIRYAENPPKKYEDIYPINFYCPDHMALWEELKSILDFWIEKGVKIFRVDNPHTKPLRFWKWLIDSVRQDHPDVLFLAEAFTRPKVMKFLAKAGFSQSYTYFTWRNAKWELQQYLEELTQSEMKYYFRPNFFANTPDILTEILQRGGRPAFKMRLVLAATLASSYGIYSGFELCENEAARPGSEEYLNSEKYEYKVRDWNQPGNLSDFIARVNRIRCEHPALQSNDGLKFYHTTNDQILAYGKHSADGADAVIVVVNLNPHQTIEDLVTLPLEEFGLEAWQTYQMKDLVTGEKYDWKGATNFIRLDPNAEPAHIFELRK